MSTPNRFVLAVVGLAAGVGLGGVLLVLQMRSSRLVKLPPPVTTPASALSTDPTPEPTVLPGGPVGDPQRGKIFVFRLKMTEDGTSLEKTPLSAPTGQPESQALTAIAAMAGQSPSPLPRGTRATSVVFEGPLVTIDLSAEFKDNFEGGETMEALALNAITGVLGQFPGVKKVQILVAGKKIDSLGGAQSLREPLSAPTP